MTPSSFPTRSASLDALKSICAILIVFLHCSSPHMNFLIPITRCAVPCFFFISGYFLYDPSRKIQQDRIDKSLRRVGRMTLYSFLLFAVLEESISLCLYREWIPLTLKDLFKLIIFNKVPFGYHLWYLSAYLYVLLIVRFFPRFTKYFLYCVPLILLINISFGKYSRLFFHQEWASFYLRNFFFFGLPCFLMGQWIARNKDRFAQIKSKSLLYIFIFMVLLSEGEYFFLNTQGLDVSGDIYLSSIPLALVLFLLFLNLKNGLGIHFFEEMGRKDSLLIFILHPLVASLLLLAIREMPEFETIYKGYPFAFLVLSLSFIVSRMIQSTRILPFR